MTSPASERIIEQRQMPYSTDEQVIIKKMESLMNGAPFHYLEKDESISGDERDTRRQIISSLNNLILNIRSKKADLKEFFDYQDMHFDAPDHAWLQTEHPGVNVTGWRVVMVLMDPLTYGKGLDRPIQTVHGTISQRSAKR